MNSERKTILFSLLLFAACSSNVNQGHSPTPGPTPMACLGSTPTPTATPVNAYYISNSGKDSNDGRSPTSAWQTIDKINRTTLVPGDAVLFERGGTYTGGLLVKNSGTEDSPITFAAYGTGNKPVLDAQLASDTFNCNERHYLTLQDLVLTNGNGANFDGWDVGNIVVRNVDLIHAQHINMYIYGSNSVISHCTFGEAVESHGMYMDMGSNNLVEYCDFYSNGLGGNPTGNGGVGFQFNSGDLMHSANHVIRYNVTRNNNDDGIWDGGGDNILIHDNIIYNNGGNGIGLSSNGDAIGPTFASTNDKIYNNIIVIYEHASYGAFIRVSDSANNATIENNIFFGGTNAGHDNPFFYIAPSGSILSSDYNLFFKTGDVGFHNDSSDYGSLTDWTSGTGYDTHSKFADPLFADLATWDFHPTSTSPTIDVGTDVGVTRDFDCNAVPKGPGVDIGAYEY